MTEKFADELAAVLDKQLGRVQPSGLELRGWRFDLHDLRLLEVGIKNSRLGGPYTSPSYKEDLGGEVFLHWNNNRYSSGKLDRHVLQEFATHWDLWQRTAYTDEDGPELAEPYNPPEIPLEDAGVYPIIQGENRLPFTVLAQLQQGLVEQYGLHKMDARFKVTADRRIVRNSLGFAVDYRQTPVQIFAEAEDTFGEAFAEKRLPKPEEISHLINYVGEVTNYLRQEITLPATGRLPIILAPAVTEAFLAQFLLHNLQGSLVANRQSAFAIGDFQEKRQVFRSDLALVVDGTRPMRAGSYRCTAEGVATGRIELIRGGRLQTPILSRKYAKRLGMVPTPVPGAFLLEVPMVESLEALYARVPRCLVVHSVLGLHTQDASSGIFSLTADQCLWVESGEIKGKVKAVIAGNFFAALASKETLFAKSAWDDNPACLFVADVAK
ncbi:MAG: metallopeptidase TldD-related protein [Bacillota bacterium]|jgi:PmbA protein